MLDDLMQRHPEFPSPEIDARVTTSMLFALTLRQPHHRDIRTWADRARTIAQKSTNIRLKSFIYVYLELYYLWIGDHAGAEFVIKGVRESAATPDASPLAQILGRIIEAVYQVRMGSHDLCRKAVVGRAGDRGENRRGHLEFAALFAGGDQCAERGKPCRSRAST